MNKYRFPAFFLLLLIFFWFSGQPAQATLNNAKDTISTSRPSASTPLVSTVLLNTTQATIYDNGSRFIASDSAKLIGGPAALETVTVASMSAGSTPTSGQRVVFFTGVTSGSHMAGSVIMTPVTAKHTVSFNSTALPSSGKIQVVFPVGDTSNQASPSASGFSLNSIASGNITVTGATASCTGTAATGTIECTLSAVFSGGDVTVTIGSSTPALVNPTKTAGAGTADIWTVQIKTYDNNDVLLDSERIKIGTIDSVEVYATVNPELTFTIAGINNAAAINTGNTTGCTNTETVNTGINSSATDVNLGALTSGAINIGAQLITITTNGAFGYTLTATSSGHLIDPTSSYWIADAQGTPTNNDTPVPVVLTAGTTAFGIHSCGLDVNTTTWGSGATGGGAGAKYAHPSATYYYSLASDSTGPVANSLVTGNGLTSMEYAATISSAVPGGYYRTVLTYVATPVF